MKNIKQKILWGLIGGALTFGVIGITGMNYDVFNKESTSINSIETDTYEVSKENLTDVNLEENNVTKNQKLIYRSSFSVETKNYDKSAKNLKKYVSDSNGYIENVDSFNYNNSKNSSFIIRIPTDSYDKFIGNIQKLGNITTQTESVEDITASYLDVEARVNNLKLQLTRLQELQGKTENLDQLLLIENQITDVQYQIESYTSQLEYLQKQCDYCTVEIYLSEVVAYNGKGDFINRIIETNKTSLHLFAIFVENVALFLVLAYPYLIIILILSLIILLISKLRKKKTDKRNDGLKRVKNTKEIEKTED